MEGSELRMWTAEAVAATAQNSSLSSKRCAMVNPWPSRNTLALMAVSGEAKSTSCLVLFRSGSCQ
eukprot:9486672-Pyramimonas_sp.AAC.1